MFASGWSNRLSALVSLAHDKILDLQWFRFGIIAKTRYSDSLFLV